ncbi:PQQ-binding-like beta-propeller repeat protein [Cellulomonas sp. 73-92]|uniref:outer membrane protein assembly factor BamB family protein n=1 Tax=Cellulomonas sp. 73-92 TaxID=1895740 RepID=UPI0025C4A2FE|nr:PQQ-binding-like beta-propeller repeat protein [Cellulomonas sp. 73-92]
MARRMVDVELVGDEPPRGEPDPVTEWLRRVAATGARAAQRVGAVVGPRAARAWRRPTVRWVALGLAAAVVVVPVADASRERTRLAALAQVPGLLAPLHPGLRVLYTLPGSDYGGTALQDGFLVGRTVVDALSLFGENSTLVALDAATGARRWSTTLGDRDAWGDAIPRCAAAGGVVACEVTGGPGRASGPTVTTTWAVDPADGRLLRGVTYGDHVLAATVGDLMVVAQQVAGPDRAPASGAWSVTWRVTGQDPATGATRWTWTGPAVRVAAEDEPTDPFHDPTDYGADLYPVAGPLRATDTALRVGDDTWLFGAGGTVRVHLHRAGGWALTETRGGSVVRQPLDLGAVRARPPWELLLDDGTWRPLAGTPLPAVVDDGSVPDAVLLTSTSGTGTTLTAVDRHTGATLWQAPIGPPVVGPRFTLSGVVLDGRVYTGLQDLRAFDAATGRPLWTVAGAGGWLSTDGTLAVVLTTSAQGFPLGVRTYALADGRARWTADVRALLATQGKDVNLSTITFGLPVRHIGAVRADGLVAVLG